MVLSRFLPNVQLQIKFMVELNLAAKGFAYSHMSILSVGSIYNNVDFFKIAHLNINSSDGHLMCPYFNKWYTAWT